MNEERQSIAVLGGSGKEGGGLTVRLARAGYPVIIGSRSEESAAQAAAAINAKLGQTLVTGMNNLAAAKSASLIILSVPYSAQQALTMSVASELNGKILIDVTVPLVPPKVGTVQLPAGGSAVAALQVMLGESVRVVSAFQNISAHHLEDPDAPIECDVLVCSDDREAADRVVELAREMGMVAWNAGPLANSAASEALTSILITLNRRHKVIKAGIRLTGLPTG